MIQFPPVDQADESGLIAVGGEINTEYLLAAYSQGIFPWPCGPKQLITWFAPPQRGILPLQKMHISKSLQKAYKKHPYTIKFNQDFQKIIQICAEIPRQDQTDTWITNEIQQGYYDLFQNGYAYCVGAYKNDILVGGLYGTCFGNFYSGESMFQLESNTSKFCLLELAKKLRLLNIEWLDTQMLTETLLQFGGIEIDRKQFMQLIQFNNFKIPSQKKLS